MGGPAKWKTLIVSQKDVGQDTASEMDAQPTKKRKQDCSPSGETRCDLPLSHVGPTPQPSLQLTNCITGYLPLVVGGCNGAAIRACKMLLFVRPPVSALGDRSR